jgi:hypothetical protein
MIYLSIEDKDEALAFLTQVQEHKIVARPVVRNGVTSWRRSKVVMCYVSEQQVENLSNEGLTIGVFRYEGDIYVCKPNAKRTHSYAMKVVPCTPRVLEKTGATVTQELEYAPGILRKLTEDDRMSEADTAEFLIQYGRCIRCNRPLKLEKSVRGMMGKRCSEFMGFAWGETR